jgi:AraC-like DNA-binding protein
MKDSFPIDSPIGTWWQIRTFDARERDAATTRGWNENRGRRPAGIALFQFTLRGKLIYRDKDGTRDVPPGWAMLCLSGEESSYAASGQEVYESFWISFSGAGLAEHWNDIRQRFGSVVRLGLRNSVLDYGRALCRVSRPRNTAESVQRSSDVHAFLRLLQASLESTSQIELSDVDRAVNEFVNCMDGNLSIAEVASRHGVSREHFTRVFSQKQGMPPARFLARLKLRRATALLTDTNLSVLEIAQQCGFGSKQALIRWTRRELGCLPGEYRTSQRSRRS